MIKNQINVEYEDQPAIIADLEKRFENKRRELLSLLDKWHRYHTTVKPQILFDYERIFGDIEIELKNKKKEATELEQKADIYSRKVKRGEKINDYTIQIVDLIVSKRFNKNKEQSDYYKSNPFSFNKDKQKSGGFKASNFNFFSDSEKQPNDFFSRRRNYRESREDSFKNGGAGGFRFGFKNDVSRRKEKGFDKSYEEFQKERQIPKLYRAIVKRIHPDVSGESEEFLNYWHNVQDAYRRKSYNRLKMFYITLCNDIPKPKNDDLTEKVQLIRKAINEIDKHIFNEKVKLEKLKKREPFNLSGKLRDKLWIAKRKRSLKGKLFELNRTIQMKKTQISILIKTNKPAKTYN